MKTLKQHINESLKIGKNLSEWSAYSCQPKTRSELKEIIKDRISKEGLNCDLNDIDISLITDMSNLFDYSLFNGDISDWNVSNVQDMKFMFCNSMFKITDFNQDISNWKINKDCNINHVFEGCPIEEEFEPKTLQL